MLEAAKGLLVIAAGFGLLSLLHRDAEQIAIRLIETLHLDPARRIPRIFIDAASRLTDTRLWGLAAMAFGYAALRLAEAWGLWRHRRWAEWLGVLSGGLYVPLEAYELAVQPSGWKLATLLVNLAVIAYLARSLRRRDADAQMPLH